MNDWFTPAENQRLLKAMAPGSPLLDTIKTKAGEALFIFTILGGAFGCAFIGYAIK